MVVSLPKRPSAFLTPLSLLSIHTEGTSPMPLEIGSRVLYTSRGVTSEAVILAVHLDDDLKPFYTIWILEGAGGREKQTDGNHIVPISFPRESKDQSTNSCGRGLVDSNRYPVQERRYNTDEFIDLDGPLSDNDHDKQSLTKHQIDAKATVVPVSILRSSSYGQIPYNDMDSDDFFDAYSDEVDSSVEETADRRTANEIGGLFGNASNPNPNKRQSKREVELRDAKRARFNHLVNSSRATPSNSKRVTPYSIRRKEGKLRNTKPPSLLRPPIDKKYFMRVVNPRTGAKSCRLRDQKIFLNYPKPEDCKIMDVPNGSPFDSQSNLSKEITAKVLRRANKDQHASLKRWEDLAQSNYLSQQTTTSSPPERAAPPKKSTASSKCNTPARSHQITSDKEPEMKQASMQTEASTLSKHVPNQRIQNQTRPMITFAPEEKKRNSTSNLFQQSQFNNVTKHLHMSSSDSRIEGLPFHFMPAEDKVVHHNSIKKRNSFERAILTVIGYLKSIAISICVVFFRALVYLARFVVVSLAQEEQDQCSSSRAVHPQRRQQQRSVTGSTEKLQHSNHRKSTVTSGYQCLPRFKHLNPRTPIHVKNPKGPLPLVPAALDFIFESPVHSGEWSCKACGFKNPADTLTCDKCLAVKLDERMPMRMESANEPKSNDDKKSGYKPESSPSAMSCDTAPEEEVDSVDEAIEQLHSANHIISPLPSLKRDDPGEFSSHKGSDSKRSKGADVTQSFVISNTFEQTSKKRSTDVGDDEFRSKRIGIDRETTNHASSHKQQDARSAQSSKKRSTELGNDDCTSKRLGIDHDDSNVPSAYLHEHEYQDFMDISPSKNK